MAESKRKEKFPKGRKVGCNGMNTEETIKIHVGAEMKNQLKVVADLWLSFVVFHLNKWQPE